MFFQCFITIKKEQSTFQGKVAKLCKKMKKWQARIKKNWTQFSYVIA